MKPKEADYAEWHASLVATGDPIVDAVGVYDPKEPVAGLSGASGSVSRPRRASANAPVYETIDSGNEEVLDTFLS